MTLDCQVYENHIRWKWKQLHLNGIVTSPWNQRQCTRHRGEKASQNGGFEQEHDLSLVVSSKFGYISSGKMRGMGRPRGRRSVAFVRHRIGSAVVVNWAISGVLENELATNRAAIG